MEQSTLNFRQHKHRRTTICTISGTKMGTTLLNKVNRSVNAFEKKSIRDEKIQETIKNDKQRNWELDNIDLLCNESLTEYPYPPEHVLMSSYEVCRVLWYM